MSRHSWFKSFSKREYAESFLDGRVRFSTLAYFRDFEQSEIGDRREGTKAWMPEGGVILTDHKTSEPLGKFIEPFGFEALVKHPGEIFVFCVSHSLTEALTKGLESAVCIEITNKTAFFERLDKALPQNGKRIAGSVEYYDRANGEASVNTLMNAPPKRIVLSKPKEFSYQNEYRFAFCVTEALESRNAAYCLREFKHAPDTSQHHVETLALGCLRDICKEHVIESG